MKINTLYLLIPDCFLLFSASKYIGCIYHSLRSYNFFTLPEGVTSRCNVGGFGIDGGVSTFIGSSLASPDRLHIGVFGDLAFFYDMNVVGNRHVGNNVRILLINNGKGNEFRNYNHPCYFLGDDADEFVAAAGHYGNKSFDLVKHYATGLGYEYLTAKDKESFISVIDRFLTPEITNRPIIMEVFTETDNESNALETILKMEIDKKHAIKQAIKGIVGDGTIKTAKKILGK